MSLALLQTALLLPIEALLNGVLALDAASRSRLAALEGKTLAVLPTQPRVALYVSIRNGQVRLAPLFEGNATSTLRGPAGSLLRLLLRGDTPASLAPYGVELQGSTAFMQELQQLLRDLDIDWEFHLGRLIGDLPVAALAQGLDAGADFAGNTLAAARDNVADYLAHETSLLPARSAVEKFRADLLELHLHIDRLQARLDLLQR